MDNFTILFVLLNDFMNRFLIDKQLSTDLSLSHMYSIAIILITSKVPNDDLHSNSIQSLWFTKFDWW